MSGTVEQIPDFRVDPDYAHNELDAGAKFLLGENSLQARDLLLNPIVFRSRDTLPTKAPAIFSVCLFGWFGLSGLAKQGKR
jgi:hypothetical protein